MAAYNWSVQVATTTYTRPGAISASDATRYAAELKTYYNVSTDAAAATALLDDVAKFVKRIVNQQLNSDAVAAVTPFDNT